MASGTGKPLSEWSDAEIRCALLVRGENAVPVTPTTRPLLLRKLERLMGEAQEETASEETTSPGHSQPSGEGSGQSTPAASDGSASIEGYYGVAANVSGVQDSVQLSPFYTSRADTLRAIKTLPGARFKKFSSQQDAEAFSQHQGAPAEAQNSPAGSVVASEKANSYPKVKTQDLTKLRKLIEEGNMAAFANAVWNNPRHLITSGDAPEILQEGFRYNALHCAVKAHQLDICREIFVIVQSNRFWELVYPDDSGEVRAVRRSHLIDLYLNMQDKINNETPLHFACKLGFEDIVSFLLSFPETDTNVRNRYGETPGEVACRNTRSRAPNLRERIQELLRAPEVYYVPVLRAVDNSTPPQLCPPCTMEDYLWQESSLADDTGTPVRGQAFAGPMSPSKADEFYREWRLPSQGKERTVASHVKRSDPTKGFERVGRQMARQRQVGWAEYWDFLGCFCDLSRPEDMRKLEHYLTTLEPPMSADPSPQLCSSMSNNGRGIPSSCAENDTAPQRIGERILSPVSEVECSLSRELFPEGVAEGTESSEKEGRSEATEEPSVEDVDVGGTMSSENQCEWSGVNRTEDPTCAISSEESLSETAGIALQRITGRSPHNPANTVVAPVAHSPQPSADGTVGELAQALESLGVSSGEGNGAPVPVPHTTTSVVTPVKVRGFPHTTNTFLTGPTPTRLDYDVYLAISQAEVDLTHFPLLNHWLTLVRTYSDQEQRSWQTPVSLRPRRSLRGGSSLPVSPLVVSSPPPGLSPLRYKNLTPSLRRTRSPLQRLSLTPRF